MDGRGPKGCLAAAVLFAGTVHLPANRLYVAPGRAVDIDLPCGLAQPDLLGIVCMSSTMFGGHCVIG